MGKIKGRRGTLFADEVGGAPHTRQLRAENVAEERVRGDEGRKREGGLFSVARGILLMITATMPLELSVAEPRENGDEDQEGHDHDQGS